MIFKNFDNFGFIKDKLPDDLFNSLLKESLNFKTKKRFITGLSGNGTPNHYKIVNKENLKNLNLFLSNLILKYENNFKYLKRFKFLTNDVPLFFDEPWINIQKKGEFIPHHTHDGIFSYTIWLKIPYDLQKEIKDSKFATAFEFSYSNILGELSTDRIFLDKNDEGKIILFPSKLTHMVYPFLKCNDVRISLSGNILLDTKKL
jgi:hypothetical protein